MRLCAVIFAGVEGRTALPAADQLPQKTYLAYGSSITHGSLSLIQPDCYVFRNAQALGVDYLNLGFAGNALMEEEMANYLVSRRDWDFASVEMGINTTERVKEFPLEVFEERIDRFTAVLARDPRPVFATSFFGYLDEDTDRHRQDAPDRAALRRRAAHLYRWPAALDVRPLSRQTAPPDAAGRSRLPHAGAASWRKRLPTARRGEFFGRLSFCTKLGVKIHKILTFAIRAFALTLPSLHGTIK